MAKTQKKAAVHDARRRPRLRTGERRWTRVRVGREYIAAEGGTGKFALRFGQEEPAERREE